MFIICSVTTNEHCWTFSGVLLSQAMMKHGLVHISTKSFKYVLTCSRLEKEIASWSSSSSSESEQQKHKYWLSKLEQAQVYPSHQEGVLRILSHLFPEAGIDDNQLFDVNESTVSRSVSDADYFDRYFEFGVPSDDLSDAVARQALHDLASTSDSVACESLRKFLVNDIFHVPATPENRRRIALWSLRELRDQESAQ